MWEFEIPGDSGTDGGPDESDDHKEGEPNAGVRRRGFLQFVVRNFKLRGI